MYPSRQPFAPDLVVPGLGRGPGDELTADDFRQIARELGDRDDDEIVGRLEEPLASPLSPVERARALWWLRGCPDRRAVSRRPGRLPGSKNLARHGVGG
ncbi:MAG TPA: hypothetical protein VF951_05350 [Streptosporangiaceae bacterium]